MLNSRDYCLPTEETIRQINAEVLLSPSGKLLSAKSRQRYVIDRLIDLGYIDNYQAEYALVFMGVRMAWMAPVEYKCSSLCDDVTSWFDGTGISPASIYDHVYRSLKARRTRIIVYAASTHAEKDKSVESAVCGEVYAKCFEMMVTAMDEAREEFKKALAI